MLAVEVGEKRFARSAKYGLEMSSWVGTLETLGSATHQEASAKEILRASMQAWRWL